MRQTVRFTALLVLLLNLAFAQTNSQEGTAPLSNMELVKHAYEVFAQGDVPAFLGLLDPEVEWIEPAGVPGIEGTYIGPDSVLNDVLVPLTTEWQGLTLAPEEFFDAGDVLVVLGSISATHSTTGEALSSPHIAVWTLRDGKVVKYQSFVNTAAFVEAAR